MKLFYSLLIGLFVLVITFFATKMVMDINQYSNVLSLENAAQRETHLLQVLVNEDIDHMGVSAHLFHSDKQLNAQDFAALSKRLIESGTALLSLQWMKKVEKSDIDHFVAQKRKVNSEFDIFTVPQDKPKYTGYYFQDDRPIYVVADIYPKEESFTRILGFYPSRTRFEHVTAEMLKSGKPNVSDKLRLLQDSQDKSAPKAGMLIYYPVIQSDEIIGIMVGAFRISRYFDDLLGKTLAGDNLQIQIMDSGYEADDDPLLFQSANWQEEGGISVKSEIRLQNRVWKIHFKTTDTLNNTQKTTVLFMIIIGVIISVLLSFITFLISRDKQEMAEILDKKTQELQYLAHNDIVTGIFNRRHFATKLEKLIATESDFSLITFDVDEFKLINDNYGHLAGDAVLKHIADMVSGLLRPEDTFSRHGGDEFSILSILNENDKVEKLIEDIRNTIANSPTTFEQIQLHQTVSIGAKVWHGESLNELYKKVDLALYTSKDSGRNRATLVK
ncbi:sensor domain-containing diguanylate cyclase [Aliivibrio kagoshimensis]|uniref:sensor domain-containing diguanylate cyclase n=1 Tax=Aliivibrio kagoshimensis TaxID=2910230 RepID=UPI003D0D977D